MMSKCKASTHHFRGLEFYTDDLRAFAEGRPAFTGKGKKPRNKEVLAAIKSIENGMKLSQQGKFFNKSSAPKQHVRVVGIKKHWYPLSLALLHLSPLSKRFIKMSACLCLLCLLLHAFHPCAFGLHRLRACPSNIRQE